MVKGGLRSTALLSAPVSPVVVGKTGRAMSVLPALDERTSPFFQEHHHAWRATLRRWVEAEIMPFADEWDEAGTFPRELYRKASDVGLIGLGYPEEFGG